MQDGDGVEVGRGDVHVGGRHSGGDGFFRHDAGQRPYRHEFAVAHDLCRARAHQAMAFFFVAAQFEHVAQHGDGPMWFVGHLPGDVFQ